MLAGHIRQLRQITGTTEKMEYIKECGEDFYKLALYALHPTIRYNITSESIYPIDEVDLSEPSVMTEAGYKLLDKLATGSLRGSEAYTAVANYVDSNGWLILLALEKTLLCGIGAKTINKVRKGFIPEFKIDLAKKGTDSMVHKKYPKIMQPKYDGARLIIVKIGNNVTMYTRSGKQLMFRQLKTAILDLYKDVNCMLDGELIYDTGLPKDRPKAIGKVNSAIASFKKNLNGRWDTNLVYVQFDYLPIKDWLDQKSRTPKYLDRLSNLRATDTLSEAKVLKSVAYEVSSFEEVQSYYKDLIAKQYEGVILRDRNKPYAFKRTANILKLKPTYECVAEVTGVEGGTGKYYGMIGKLEYKATLDNGKVVRGSVGSGLSDWHRNLPPGDLVGKRIEIEYFGISQTEYGEGESLSHPSFKRIVGEGV